MNYKSEIISHLYSSVSIVNCWQVQWPDSYDLMVKQVPLCIP